MNEPSLKLKKQHINAKVYANYLLYLKRNYPQIDANDLVESCGLSIAYLNSPAAWVSTKFDRDFTLRCLNLTREKNFIQNVSAFAISKDGLPAPFFLAARLVSTVSFLYLFLIQKIFPDINRVVSLRIKNEMKGRFEIEMAPIQAGLNEEDAAALVENFPNIVDSISGYFTGFPVLLNMPAAKVITTMESDPTGAPFCRMTIEYMNHNALGVTLLYFFAFILSTATFLLLRVELPLYIVLPFSGIWILLALLIRSFSRMSGLKAISADAQKGYADLQNQYSETFAAKTALDRSLREQDVVNMLLRTLIQVQTASDVIKNGCTFLVEQFGFDRVVVLHLNEAKDSLVYNYGSSTQPESLNFFSQLVLPTEIESTDPTKLTNVFRLRRSVLIEDCKLHMQNLSDDGRRFLQASKSQSFVAVPIVANDTCFGIFVIDAFERRRKLTKDDLHLAEKVANAVAAALEKNYLQAAREEALERSNKFKDQILANTSHELRTPINGIVNFARIVSETASPRLTASEKEFLSSIEQAGNRLSRLVNNILEQSVQSYGNLSLRIEPVNLFSVVGAVSSEVEFATEKKAVEIVLDEGMRDIWVTADKDKLFQILVNLLHNALKFTPRGSVAFTAVQHDKTVVVSVSDTGIGIPEADREKIFEPFVKSQSKQRQDGAGLGLAITKGLVTRMGGRIWVESPASQAGTRMCFSLPAATERQTELVIQTIKSFATESAAPIREEVQNYLTQEDSHVSQPRTQSFNLAEERPRAEQTVVLIVDDEPINVTILTHFLQGSGFTVVCASDGQAALERISEGLQPDLVLLDIMMPGLDGYEVCERLRTRYPAMDLPILMMSAKQEVEDVLKGFQKGANDYVSKPFVKEVLLARVVSHLGVSHMSRVASRFVPWELVRLLGAKDLTEVQLGKGSEFEIAVFYIDLRKFTELLESMACSDAFNFLNSFLGHVVPTIMRNRGIVDKYIGDCVMGVFLSADDAIEAATEIQKSMMSYNLQHRSGGSRKFINAGIAIHWGSAFVGSVGIAKRLEITVISDAVNTGARMQELTKTYGVEIVVSQSIVDHASKFHDKQFRYLDDVALRGRKEKVRIYAVQENESFDTPAIEVKAAS